MTSPAIDWLDALNSLTAGLIEAGGGPVEAVERSRVPPPFSSLLVHHEHMTSVLESHHSAQIVLEVLRHEQKDNLYRRMILLRRADTRQVVEFGIVRIHLACIDPAVRDEILARRTPLGHILIRNDVLRTIEPRWFVKFGPESGVADYFSSSAGGLYGRLGIIHYDGQPAIELLEVVCA